MNSKSVLLCFIAFVVLVEGFQPPAQSNRALGSTALAATKVVSKAAAKKVAPKAAAKKVAPKAAAKKVAPKAAAKKVAPKAAAKKVVAKKVAPKKKVVKPSSPPKPFENAIGAQPPLGLFDPLGLLDDGNQSKFDRLRYVEIKHGRVCMLGVVGYLVTYAGIRLPGQIALDGTKFSDIPAGWAGTTAVPVAGALQVLLLVGFLELFIMKDVTGGVSPGDFRNGLLDFGWDTFDAETKVAKQAIELNQGRAAMMGMIALMVHDKLGNVDLFFPKIDLPL